MSDRPAIELKGVGKRYTLYPSPLAGACDALGLAWLLPGRHRNFRQFWALRNINLTLPRGARIGIIGRNGAGKSTLLKLITGNIHPTEGHVEVNGEVQALLQAGTGMHPEFTGYENIEAALTYQGLSASEMDDAVADIREFTELGPFLDQPFKTYSTGMQARLAFATATVVKPDILIIDELLGVGDGYFVSKSTERVEKLIRSGASVLLVSHSMEQILRFSEQAIWVDRGQIVRQGDALEVVKEYERYLRVLDERRLKAKNARLPSTGDVESQFTDALTLRFRVAQGGKLRVGAITFVENDRQQDRLHVGGPQDSTPGNSTYLQAETIDAWSMSHCRDGQMFRELDAANADVCGEVVFSLYLFDASVTYGFEIDYQLEGSAVVEICREGHVLQSMPLNTNADWQIANAICAQHENGATKANSAPKAHHWPGGVPGLRIEAVRMFDEHGREAASFAFDTRMSFEIQIGCGETGSFPLTPLVAIYRRSDGINVSQHIGERQTWTMNAGDTLTARLQLGPLQLGNDTYVVSVGLFRTLDPMQIEAPAGYDILDRSVEFRVHGREPFRRGIFQHPEQWDVRQNRAVVAA